MNKPNQTKTENRVVVTRWEVGCEMGKEGQVYGGVQKLNFWW